MNICTPTNWITYMKWINSYKDTTKLTQEVGYTNRPITSKEIEFFKKQTQNCNKDKPKTRWLHD